MINKKLFFILIGCTILSCNSNDEAFTNTFEYSEYISDNSINSEIKFMPWETYSSDGPQEPLLKLKLITSEYFPCINYGLSTSEFMNGNEFIIRFDEIIQPSICLTAIGPAISYVDLPLNTSKLTFINGDVIDRYSVNINDTKVLMTHIESNFTSSLYDKTFRYPINSFAVVCGTNTTNTYIYDDFSALLAQNPNFTEFQFEGEGRIPYPESSSGHWVDHPSKYYTYTDSQEFNNMATILNTFSSENIEENSGVSIAIWSWNNLQFMSWLDN